MHKSDHGGCLFPKTSKLDNYSRYVLLQYLKVCNPVLYKYSAALQALPYGSKLSLYGRRKPHPGVCWVSNDRVLHQQLKSRNKKLLQES